jgi:cytosine/adenosine deaminase-related metal-dependent hydrolase
MTYRKFKADNLFTGKELAGSDQVLITDHDGVVESIVKRDDAGDDLEVFSGILSPGFINCHCHLELSHLKNIIPERSGLVDFLSGVMQHRSFNAERIGEAIVKGEQEMFDNGIVAVGDICNTPFTILQKKQHKLFYHNFIEAIGILESDVSHRYEDALKILQLFRESLKNETASQTNRSSLVPHAPYSVSKELFKLILNLPGNDILSIHNQECDDENEFFETGMGCFPELFRSMGLDISSIRPSGSRSLQSWWNSSAAKKRWILVHNVSTNEEDIRFLFNTTSAKEIFFCLCPNANLYIQNKLPPVDLFVKHNCSMVIGTDSLASNHQLNILDELKTLQFHFPALTAVELLKWATLNGAIALNTDQFLGSFEKGKRPGVILIENFDGEKFNTRSKVRRVDKSQVLSSHSSR